MNVKILVLRVLSFDIFLIRIRLCTRFRQIPGHIICSLYVQRALLLFIFLLLQIRSWCKRKKLLNLLKCRTRFSYTSNEIRLALEELLSVFCWVYVTFYSLSFLPVVEAVLLPWLTILITLEAEEIRCDISLFGSLLD